MRKNAAHPVRLILRRAVGVTALTVLSCGVIGCNGQIYTVKPPEWENGKLKGVLAYPLVQFLEISYTTSVLKTKTIPAQGNQPAKTEKTTEVERIFNDLSPNKHCKPTMVVNKVVRGDYENPYQLYYSPGVLEKYTFKADFDQGVLKSINAESTPDKGETLKNISTVASDFAKIAAMMLQPDVDGAGVHHCTDEPLLVYIKRVDEVCKKDRGGMCDYSQYPFPYKENHPVRLPTE